MVKKILATCVLVVVGTSTGLIAIALEEDPVIWGLTLVSLWALLMGMMLLVSAARGD